MAFSLSGHISQYSYSLRAGLSVDGIPVEARSSAPVYTDREAHPASFIMGNEFLYRGEAAGTCR
jgi:hypothetical protein